MMSKKWSLVVEDDLCRRMHKYLWIMDSDPESCEFVNFIHHDGNGNVRFY